MVYLMTLSRYDEPLLYMTLTEPVHMSFILPFVTECLLIV
jgi:hypothetical protein